MGGDGGAAPLEPFHKRSLKGMIWTKPSFDQGATRALRDTKRSGPTAEQKGKGPRRRIESSLSRRNSLQGAWAAAQGLA